MTSSLLIVAVLVLILWIVIVGIFLVVSRRQPDVAESLAELEAQLDASEGEQ